jgi:hypothetical protein
MTDDQEHEPKIVVDEDWKGKVEREKEAAEVARQATQQEATGDTGEAQQQSAGQIPPASFGVLISSFAAQAMTAMGQIPDPVEGHAVVRPDLAKHCIDMLGMLEEKTKGNLTPEETRMLSDVLHQLRMLFVATRKAPVPEDRKQEAEN